MATKKRTNRKYSFFPHTADSKFRAYGKNTETQFANAALALTSIMFEHKKITPRQEKKISVSGADMKALLYNWLEELLFLLDTKGFVLHAVKKLKISKNKKYKLSAVVQGDSDQGKYEVVGSLVKAVTYSEMEITKKYVQVVVDI